MKAAVLALMLLAAPAVAAELPTVRAELVDAALTDRHGRPARLVREVVGDKVAVVNFIYSRCSTTCPLTSALLTEVQSRLGERLGRDVVLVSLSLDPVIDTPDFIRRTADIFGAGPHWHWLTGDARQVRRAVEGLGASLDNIESHAPVVLVGRAGESRWVRLDGLGDPALVLAAIEQLARKAGS